MMYSIALNLKDVGHSGAQLGFIGFKRNLGKGLMKGVPTPIITPPAAHYERLR